MDTPAHFRDYQDLLRDIDLLDTMNLNDVPSHMVRPFLETLTEIQSRLDRLRTIAFLRSIPELVQAAPPDRVLCQHLGRTSPPHTQQESLVLSPGHINPPESPLSDQHTEEVLSFCDAIDEIQQRLDYIRMYALLRGIMQLVQTNPQVRVPLQPRSLPPTLNNREELPEQLRTVSQDEMVIRQRGRKRLPVTWSPDIHSKGTSSKAADLTPPKITPRNLVSQKAALKVRSAGLKRLRFW